MKDISKELLMLLFWAITDNKKPNVGATQVQSSRRVLLSAHSTTEIKLASEYCFAESKSPTKGQVHLPIT